MNDSLRLDRQLGETTNMIAVALKAGYRLPQIIDTLAEQLPEPAKSMMVEISAELTGGASIQRAFQVADQKFPSNSLPKITEALTATPLVPALEAVATELIAQWGRDEAVDAASQVLRQAVHAPHLS